jgi:hypothetical protein
LQNEGVNADLPYVDEHAVRIPVPRDLVWTALQRYVSSSLSGAEGSPLTRILGTEPRAGFEVFDSVPAERLTLVGRHRFARYRLSFELTDATHGATQLRAQSYAAFPGLHGRAYRALVIGMRLHVVATNRLLRSIRRLSIEIAEAGAPAD